MAFHLSPGAVVEQTGYIISVTSRGIPRDRRWCVTGYRHVTVTWNSFYGRGRNAHWMLSIIHGNRKVRATVAPWEGRVALIELSALTVNEDGRRQMCVHVLAHPQFDDYWNNLQKGVGDTSIHVEKFHAMLDSRPQLLLDHKPLPVNELKALAWGVSKKTTPPAPLIDWVVDNVEGAEEIVHSPRWSGQVY